MALEALAADHPLAGVHFSEKGISFDTDSMGRITVTGGHSSPTGAAAALLKDLIHARYLNRGEDAAQRRCPKRLL